MKELQIIIKNPVDEDPLNSGKYIEPAGDFISVGYKFEHTDGKFYGNYFLLEGEQSEEQLLEAVRIALRMARETERGLKDRESSQL